MPPLRQPRPNQDSCGAVYPRPKHATVVPVNVKHLPATGRTVVDLAIQIAVFPLRNLRRTQLNGERWRGQVLIDDAEVEEAGVRYRGGIGSVSIASDFEVC